jgi:hypothetical protein
MTARSSARSRAWIARLATTGLVASALALGAAPANAAPPEDGASVSGTVTGAGIALGDGRATAYRLSDSDTWEAESSAPIAANGSYEIDGLPAGTYRISFSDSTAYGYDENEILYGPWREWWDDQADRTKAEAITLAAAQSRTGVDADLDTVGELPSYPSISGTARVGATLTASPGVWPAGVPLLYQWFADGKEIEGAASPTLTVTAALVGKKLRVFVAGKLDPEPHSADVPWDQKASPETAKVAKGVLKTATPKISGKYAVGSKLTVKKGTWTSGTTFTYRWYANGTLIPKATASSLTLTKAQKGKKIVAKVIGKKSGYTSTSEKSARSAKVATIATPKITGTAKVGKKLTAKPGTWTSGTKFTYQWFANGTPISKATKSTYTLKAAQKGKTVTVHVTGKKSGYATVIKSSKKTKKVT